ncbi:MAG: DUF433 domain-containing protein [Gemmatimonadales bacterium]|nr:DUF433 domain-containing protein [Gemmatimonadales bacterium]
MRALHQVVVRTAEVRHGAPVFAGSDVLVRSFLEHLDRGRDVESFLAANPTLDGRLVHEALAHGLEALLAVIPLEARPTQRSLLPRVDSAGIITNAEELSDGQVVGKRVRCPACRVLVFRSWPEGWDGHAGQRCRGLVGRDPEARKAEFKRRFGQLFRP